jgi:hypothetical protein
MYFEAWIRKQTLATLINIETQHCLTNCKHLLKFIVTLGFDIVFTFPVLFVNAAIKMDT